MGVQNPNARPATPAPAPKRYSLPSNFHTEVQNAAGTAVTQHRLQRATAPLRTPKGPTDDRSQRLAAQNAPLQAKQVVASWRQHIRTVLAQHSQRGPQGLRDAAAQLQNEANVAHDQLRLHSTALDPSLTPSHRLAAARELRTRYGLPMTTTQLLTPERMQRVSNFLRETDRHIARDNTAGNGGLTPLAAAGLDFNPLHVGKFIHSVGALSSAGANTVVGALSNGQGPQFGQINVTPKIIQKLGTNTLKDALDLPAQTVVSAYDLGNALYQAAPHGPLGRRNTKPLEEMGKGIVNLVEHPVQHPLAAALVLRGGFKGADALAGTAARAVGKQVRVREGVATNLKTGRAVQMMDLRQQPQHFTHFPDTIRGKIGKVASTGGRSPIELYGKHAIERRYASGLVSKQIQRVLDKAEPGRRIFNATNQAVRDAKGELKTTLKGGRNGQTVDLRRVQELQQAITDAKLKPGEATPLMRDRALKQRTDAAVELAHADAKMRLAQERRTLRESVPKKMRAALNPIITARLKSPGSVVQDLKDELGRLKDEETAMRKSGEKSWRVRKNIRQQHVYESLLENKDFIANPHPVFQAGDRFIAVQRQLEAKLAEHGLLDPERALRAKLIDYAARKMGARYDRASERIIAEDGQPLSNAEIMDHMRHPADGSSPVRFSGPEGRVFYRGTKPGETPKNTGFPQWDRSTFMSHDPEIAKLYGSNIERIVAKPEAKIVEAGTPEFEALRKRAGAGPMEAVKIAEHARKEGVDIVDFRRSEFGAIVLNDKAVVRQASEQPQVGFVSQRGDLGKLGDFYRNPTHQPSGYFRKRTGESARQGTNDLSYKAVDAQLASTLNILAQAEHATKIMGHFGVKPEHDMAFTSKESADSATQEMNAKNPHMQWVTVDVSPAVGDQLRAIHEHINPASVNADAQLPGKPMWFVMPKVVSDRFAEHARTLGSNTFQLSWQALTHAFRNTVLPLSIRWLTGNVVELGVRGAVARTGPLSWFVGHQMMSRSGALASLDPGAYADFMGHAVSGANYASQIRYDTYQGIERWADKGFMTHIGKGLGTALRLPPLQQLRWLYHHWSEAIKEITPRMEQEFQKAAIGKEALRELRDFNGSWLKAIPHWGNALEDVTQGLTDTNKQIQFARYVDDVVGRYNKLSPSTRQLVSGYTPFAMWYYNAIRFCFVVLPRDHPVLTGLIAAAYAGSEKERLRHGQSLTADLPGSTKREPFFLQGTILQKGGGHLPLSHYTPFGAFTDPGSVQGLVTPQISSFGEALAGVNWNLSPLSFSKGGDSSSELQRLGMALYSTAEATIPGLQIARRVMEQGGSSYDNSTVVAPHTRPDTKKGYLQALRRVGDPFRDYTPLRKNSTGSAPTPPRGPRLGTSSTPGGPRLGSGSSSGGTVKLG